jgi:23S rRNA pseudouridine955/2504/2580 synthase
VQPAAAARARRTAAGKSASSAASAASAGSGASGVAHPPATATRAPAAPSPAVPQARQLPVDAESAGQRLDNFLLRHLKGAPKTLVYRVIRSGEVRVNGGRAAADTRLAAADTVRVPPLRLAAPAAGGATGAAGAPVPPREFPVLLEDEQLLAIAKPAGVAVHGGSGVSFGVIEQLRRARPQARFLELVHRLDKETSGILLLAKKRAALTALQDQFRARSADKTYLALVFGAWPARLKVIDLPLLKTTDAAGDRQVRVVDAGHEAARRSISLVRVCATVPAPAPELPALTLLEVTIKTGRTHQIRVHLAHAGHPIVGDPKYGDFARNRTLARASGFAGMALHARRLAFDHPADGRRVALELPLPADWARLAGGALPADPAG